MTPTGRGRFGTGLLRKLILAVVIGILLAVSLLAYMALVAPRGAQDPRVHSSHD
jgi:hypothetical protein